MGEERERRDYLKDLVDEAEREGGRIPAEDILTESASWFDDLPDRR